MKTPEEQFEHFCNEIDRIGSVGNDIVSSDYVRGLKAGIRHSKVLALMHLTDIATPEKINKLIENGN